MHRAVAGFGLALAVLASALDPAGAQLYRWTDAQGVTRYTNDPATIPPAFRGGAEDLGSPQARPPAELPAPPPPGGVMTFAAGAPIHAPVRLNGVAVTLLVDTGAERTVVSPAALTRAGVAVAGGREVDIVGVTGSATAREVAVQSLEVAGTALGPMSVVAHDVAAAGVDGLLGRDVLDRFTLAIDPAAGRAVLTPR